MAKRWLIGGLAVGMGALVVAPETRTWLRRRLGLEAEDRRWFEEESAAESAEYEGDEPLDTREARYSLRARLSEDAPAEPEAESAPEPEPFHGETAEPGPFAAQAPSEPEPWPFAAEAAPEPEPFGAMPGPQPYGEPAEAPAEPAPVAAMPEPEPYPEPAEAPAEPEPVATMPEPQPEPEVARRPGSEPARELEPESTPFTPESTPFTPPAREAGYAPFESVPPVNPEADAPKTPGEDTDEVGPLPPLSSWEPTPAPPLPPPRALRPAAPPPNRPFGSRPFSGDGPSFRSAIDAARERVHGAAREATPDEGESSETPDED